MTEPLHQPLRPIPGFDSYRGKRANFRHRQTGTRKFQLQPRCTRVPLRYTISGLGVALPPK